MTCDRSPSRSSRSPRSPRRPSPARTRRRCPSGSARFVERPRRHGPHGALPAGARSRPSADQDRQDRRRRRADAREHLRRHHRDARRTAATATIEIVKTARAQNGRRGAASCSASSRSTSPSAPAAPRSNAVYPRERRDAAQQPPQRQRVGGLQRHRAGGHPPHRQVDLGRRQGRRHQGRRVRQLDQRQPCASPTADGSAAPSRSPATSRSPTPRSMARIEAQSISGAVTLRKVSARRIDVGSVSGDVALEDVQCDRVGAHSISGNVEFAGTLAKSGRYELKSHSGDVRVVLAGSTGFELEANSFSGSIRSDLPLKIRGRRATQMAPAPIRPRRLRRRQRRPRAHHLLRAASSSAGGSDDITLPVRIHSRFRTSAAPAEARCRHGIPLAQPLTDAWHPIRSYNAEYAMAAELQARRTSLACYRVHRCIAQRPSPCREAGGVAQPDASNVLRWRMSYEKAMGSGGYPGGLA